MDRLDNTQGVYGHKVKTPRTPKTPNSPTVEQLLHGDNPIRWSSSNISPTLHKDHDQEEDHFHQNKKLSVLAKVKERAKKWRQSLVKKRHSHDGNHTPSWGVALEDDENEEVPEYLGAPMYESETAPKGFKEHAEQTERAGSLFFEKHVLAGGDDLSGNLPAAAGSKKKTIIEDRKDKPLTIRKAIAEEKSRVHFPDSPRKATTSDQEAKEKWPAAVESGAAFANLSIEKKAVTEEKLETPTSPTTPKFVDAKDTLCSPRSEDDKRSLPNNLSMDPTKENEETNPATSPKNNNNNPPPAYTTALSGATLAITSKIPGMSFMNSSALDNGAEDRGMSSEGTWDKGVSVSEYIKNKFEPGDDERALSQVISETISPRRTPGDKGVMEKVKEAVTSLLHTEVQQQQAPQKTTAPNPSTPKFATSRGSSTPKAAAANPTPKITSVNSMTRAAGSSSTPKLSTPNSSISTSNASNLSTRVPPASTYTTQEADQEEHQGRILQAN